jgi:hypothetical protein
MCGWHKKYFGTELVMGTKDGQGVDGISHSICPACRELMREETLKYEATMAKARRQVAENEYSPDSLHGN